ncbi:MAG: peptide-methionine (R)-S-oxide reductase MsrB [Pseudomonadales bacterium]|jgi:peptide-methionine (R)-S-oxide reductase|nr:peptide-methionine (R)-S-oxide reductase MsrB [Pseudomonadales bacterium]
MIEYVSNRRRVLALLAGAVAAAGAPRVVLARAPDEDGTEVDWASLTEAQWRERLTEAEYRVLREEGTERAGTSPLNEEKRVGTYVCAGCALPLFSSETKYDSGTGWPSFWAPLEGAMETKRDFKLFLPRTEYHCSRCGGHQGHVFEDGPRPTGQRWCNNGVALDFVPG